MVIFHVRNQGMIEVGYFSFCFALLLSVYAFITGFFCFWKPYVALLSSSRNAIIGVFLCLLLSCSSLWVAIFSHDFSVKYVYLHSSADMPPLYWFSSFWSALEGSHLLWTFLMSFVCALSISTVKKNNFVYYPALCVSYALALIFMLTLNVSISAPLTRLFMEEKVGLGMNALLQNPYMAIHPPMLFTAYSLLIVPFAYSVGALCQGFFTHEWFSTVRKFSLVAWAFLTVAIFLGGKWAYCEIGWGGYWGWDPVENSSLMPWLALTAAIHTFLIYKNTKKLPRLGVFLFLLAFALSFQGTFITRSGIISSVHSFAESNIGPAYLAWILFLMVGIVLLIFTRGSLLEGAQSQSWGFSKEATLLLTIFFLLFTLAFVFIGTILPLVVEALGGTRISIQQPFFNAFAPWIGLGFVSILGIGNLMKWQSGKIVAPFYSLFCPAVVSFFWTLFLALQKHLELKVLFISFLIFWTCFVLLMDLFFKLKEMQWNSLHFLKYKRSYLGALIVHLGFLMALLGFTGNYQSTSVEVTLPLHQYTRFHGYKITNDGLVYHSEYNVQSVSAKLPTTNETTQESTLISPTRNKFSNSEQWFNEVGIYSTFWHDIYIVLDSFDLKTESVSLKINDNPRVKLVWTSLVVVVFGILIGLSHSKKTPPNPFSFLPKKRHQILSLGVFLFCLFCCLFAYSGIVQGQEVIPTQKNAQFVDVAKELRCPTCQGMSILESDTPQSQAMRLEVQSQLQQGKSKADIIRYFKARYGAWILREPDFYSSYGFLICIIPILCFFGGPFWILFKMQRSQKKGDPS